MCLERTRVTSCGTTPNSSTDTIILKVTITFNLSKTRGPQSISEQLKFSQKAKLEQLSLQESEEDLGMFTYAFRRLTALKTIRIDNRLSHLEEAKDRHCRSISSNRLETDNDHDANCDTYLMVMLMK